jgi:hypothetical protein
MHTYLGLYEYDLFLDFPPTPNVQPHQMLMNILNLFTACEEIEGNKTADILHDAVLVHEMQQAFATPLHRHT